MSGGNIFGIHAQILNLRAARAELLAKNLANADTPNYKARDMDFSSLFKTASNTQSVSMQRTHTQHQSSVNELSMLGVDLKYRVPGQPSLDGNTVDVHVAAKGGGSENKAKLAMLNPSDSILDWVLKTVPTLGAGWCPPGMLGIGIGGSAEKAVLLAKRSLMDSIDIHELRQRGPSNRVEELRLEIMDGVNDLGIGAQGLGGLTTVLDIKIRDFPGHRTTILGGRSNTAEFVTRRGVPFGSAGAVIRVHVGSIGVLLGGRFRVAIGVCVLDLEYHARYGCCSCDRDLEGEAEEVLTAKDRVSKRDVGRRSRRRAELERRRLTSGADNGIGIENDLCCGLGFIVIVDRAFHVRGTRDRGSVCRGRIRREDEQPRRNGYHGCRAPIHCRSLDQRRCRAAADWGRLEPKAKNVGESGCHCGVPFPDTRRAQQHGFPSQC